MSPVSVIAVHGNGGGGFRWERLPDPLADGVGLDGITLPGFAGRPLPAGPVSMATFTDAIAEHVEAHDHPRVLLGHGIGGALALDAASHRPDLVDGLILHAPVGANLDERLFPRIMSARPIRRLAQSVVGARLTAALAGPRLFDGVPAEYGRRFLSEYRRAEAFGVMFDLLTAEWFDALPATAVPTTILWGDRDRVLRVGQADDLAARLSVVDRRIVTGWGHYPMIEQPDDYARVVAEVARALVGR